MAIPTTPTYLTATEFKTLTRVASQASLTDAAINPYLLHAEWMVDSIVGVVQPYADDQVLKFPTVDSDGASWIPEEVKKAMAEITMDLISKGEPAAETPGFAKREQWNSSGYSRDNDLSGGAQKVSLTIPPLAIRLLREWVNDAGPATY